MIAVPARSEAFTVFAQQERPALDVAVVVRQSKQFFGATLEVAGEDVTDAYPAEAAARVTVDGEARTCVGRSASPEDLGAAEQAETRAGYTGMSLLAARCNTVWLVRVEGADDRVALRIAAILASVVLGPILSPDGRELFGVKTARAKLAR